VLPKYNSQKQKSALSVCTAIKILHY